MATKLAAQKTSRITNYIQIRFVALRVFKMLLEFNKKITGTLFDLFYDLTNFNLYTSGWGLNYSDLNNFLQKYNLKSKTYRVGLTIDELCVETAKTSANCDFCEHTEFIKTKTLSRGGHWSSSQDST